MQFESLYNFFTTTFVTNLTCAIVSNEKICDRVRIKMMVHQTQLCILSDSDKWYDSKSL